MIRKMPAKPVDAFSKLMIGARRYNGRCNPDPSTRVCSSVGSACSGAQTDMIIEKLTSES